MTTGGGRPVTVVTGASRGIGAATAVGLAVAAVALALKAPFIVVLLLAGAAGAMAHVLAG